MSNKQKWLDEALAREQARADAVAPARESVGNVLKSAWDAVAGKSDQHLAEAEAVLGTSSGDGDNIFSRNLGTIPDDIGERVDRIKRVQDDPSRSFVNKAAHTVAQSGGVISDVVGGALGTAMDAAVPGTPVRSVLEKLSKTETASELLKMWGQVPIELKDDLSSMGVVLEAFPAWRWASQFNRIAANSSSQVTDFYSGNVVAKFLGVGQSFGVRGLTGAAEQTLTAQGQALARNGVPQGMINEIQQLSSAAVLAKSIEKKMARAAERTQLLKEGKAKPEDFKTDEWVLTGEERQALKRLDDIGKEGELASGETPLTYIEAEIMKSSNILKQSGIDSPILDALSKPLTSYVGSLSDKVEIQKHLDPGGVMPVGVYGRIIDDVYASHTTTNPTWKTELNPRANATPEESIVVVRKANGQSAIGGEGAGQKGTPYGRGFDAFTDNEKITLRKEAKDLAKMDNKIASQQAKIDKRGEKGATTAQQRDLDALKQKKSELEQDIVINGEVATAKTTVGQLAKVFDGRFPSAKEAVDYFRSSTLKSNESANYTRLMHQKREGGIGVLSTAQQKQLQTLKAKQQKLWNEGKDLAAGDTQKLAALEDSVQRSDLGPVKEKQLASLKEKMARGNQGTLRVLGKKDSDGNPVLDADGYPEVDEDGFIYFASSHHSSEKVLGGVHTTTAFNPKTGETFVVISDGHDIFGFNPAGGKGLVTIVEPSHWNAYAKDKKGTVKKLGSDAQATYDGVVDEVYALTGIKPSGNNPGQKLTGLMTDVAQQYRPTPTRGDKVRANVAKGELGVSGGLFAPSVYGGGQEQEPEEQLTGGGLPMALLNNKEQDKRKGMLAASLGEVSPTDSKPFYS